MTPSAIHQAIRLSKHPNEMSWLYHSDAALPHGITDLLHLCSSNDNIKNYADRNHTDAGSLQKLLINFINIVLLNELNSNEKLLGVTKESDADVCKLHYQLLIKIYHPDRNPSADASYQTSKITKAYQSMKDQTTVDEYKNIRISRVHPKSFYTATSQAEQQILTVKSAFIAVFVITLISAIGIGGYLYEPATQELFSKTNTSIEDNSIENDNIFFVARQKNIFEQKKSDNNQFSMAKQASVNTSSKQQQFQVLLSGIETAYEKGDANKIQSILNSPEIKEQSEREVLAKLEKLFQITSERKMLLYDFEWKDLSGQISGKGKFLSRYQLKGQKQWLTREGIATVIASQTGSRDTLGITSLKLDNKNIDQ